MEKHPKSFSCVDLIHITSLKFYPLHKGVSCSPFSYIPQGQGKHLTQTQFFGNAVIIGLFLENIFYKGMKIHYSLMTIILSMKVCGVHYIATYLQGHGHNYVLKTIRGCQSKSCPGHIFYKGRLDSLKVSMILTLWHDGVLVYLPCPVRVGRAVIHFKDSTIGIISS